ncbi:hypothetical protein NDU88_005023 [Pleurodeles waltl]|uniref:Uncharacterized protein n=1 Tax=Pleurodeles waltl TaxID=8319 RepID=A0AAV7QDN7_PLEWA|nr:hypothetical protein NDU88_005023 [Pleurodeles waltl]
MRPVHKPNLCCRCWTCPVPHVEAANQEALPAVEEEQQRGKRRRRQPTEVKRRRRVKQRTKDPASQEVQRESTGHAS